jgi:ankyrin repeat protein
VIACIHASSQIQVLLLLLGEDGMTPLMWAAVNDQFRVALFLITKGADVNSRDKLYGWTALMHAIHNK